MKPRNRVVWVLAFGLAAWLFLRLLINPGSAYLQALARRRVQLTLGTLAAYGCFTFSVWLFFRWYASRRAPRLVPVQAAERVSPAVGEEAAERAAPLRAEESGGEPRAEPPQMGEGGVEPAAKGEGGIEPAVFLQASEEAIESVEPTPPAEPAAEAAVPLAPSEEAIEFLEPAPPAEPAAEAAVPLAPSEEPTESVVPAPPPEPGLEPAVPLAPSEEAIEFVEPTPPAEPAAELAVPLAPSEEAIEFVEPTPPPEPAAEPIVPLPADEAAVEPEVPQPAGEAAAEPAWPSPVSGWAVEEELPPPAAPPEQPPTPSPPPRKQREPKVEIPRIHRPTSLSVMAICNFVAAALYVAGAIAFALPRFGGQVWATALQRIGGVAILLALAVLSALVGWAAWTQKRWVYYVLLIEGVILLPVLLVIPGSLWLWALHKPRTQIALGRLGKKEIMALKPLAQEAMDTGWPGEAALFLRLYLQLNPLARDKEEVQRVLAGIESRLPGPARAPARISAAEEPLPSVLSPTVGPVAPAVAEKAPLLEPGIPGPLRVMAPEERTYPWYPPTWLARLIAILFALLWFFLLWPLAGGALVWLSDLLLEPGSAGPLSWVVNVVRWAFPVIVLLVALWPPRLREIVVSANQGVIFRRRNGQERPVIRWVTRLRQLPGSPVSWEIRGRSPAAAEVHVRVFKRGITGGLLPEQFEQFAEDVKWLVAPEVAIEPPPFRFRLIRWVCNILALVCLVFFVGGVALNEVIAVPFLPLAIVFAWLSVSTLWRQKTAVVVWSTLIALSLVGAALLATPGLRREFAELHLPRLQWPWAQATATLPPAPTPTAFPTATMGPTATVPAATPAAEVITYTVQAGDTLSKIAAKFGVTVEAIVEANKIEDPNVIQVGQVLVIPGPRSGQ